MKEWTPSSVTVNRVTSWGTAVPTPDSSGKVGPARGPEARGAAGRARGGKARIGFWARVGRTVGSVVCPHQKARR